MPVALTDATAAAAMQARGKAAAYSKLTDNILVIWQRIGMAWRHPAMVSCLPKPDQ